MDKRQINHREAAQHRAEVDANPWVIFLNGKVYCRTDSHAQVRRISAALGRQFPAAAIAQRYEGRTIDHQPNRDFEP